MQIHFPGLLGQARIERKLSAEVANQRLAHAYLLIGPKGSGRATLALLLFMALNCESRGVKPCLVCPSCVRAGKGQHENLIILAPPHDQASAQIKAEDLREALRATNFAPLRGGTRLILIREAEHLNLTSANALLKTLEEPPPGNLIMLSVQDTMSLLPTLVSRCRFLNLQPLNSEVMFKALQEKGCTQVAARVALSNGSLGQATQLDPELLQETLDELLKQLVEINALADLWATAAEVVGRFRGKERMDRQGIVALLSLLAQFYRDQAVKAAGRSDLALLEYRGPAMALDMALDNFNMVRVCQNQILANAQPELALTVLFSRLGRG